MESIPNSFTITVEGKKVAPPVGDSDDRIHAEFGPEAAVFTLNNGRLESDGWFLGRYLIEDRSLLPKRVYWFRAEQEDRIQPVSAEKDGDSFVLKFAGSPLIDIDDRLFVTLLGEPRHKVEITVQ